jgi:peptidoglycan/LPS O-acetylase OafA/YrhL
VSFKTLDTAESWALLAALLALVLVVADLTWRTIEMPARAALRRRWRAARLPRMPVREPLLTGVSQA